MSATVRQTCEQHAQIPEPGIRVMIYEPSFQALGPVCVICGRLAVQVEVDWRGPLVG